VAVAVAVAAAAVAATTAAAAAAAAAVVTWCEAGGCEEIVPEAGGGCGSVLGWVVRRSAAVAAPAGGVK